MMPIRLGIQRKLRFIPFVNTLVLFAYSHNSVYYKPAQIYNIKVCAIVVGFVFILAIVDGVGEAVFSASGNSSSTVLFWTCYYLGLILASSGVIKIQEKIGVRE